MKKLLYSIVLLFFVSECFATHNKAGDITYTHISGYTYQITVRTFTNTYATTADRCELEILFGDGDSASAPRVNGPQSLCTGADHDGVMVLTNIKENIYQTTHTFPGNGTYMITMEDPNRSPSICNIDNSVNRSFFLQAELIISSFLGANNGPLYTNIPVISDTIGVISHYNAFVTESDGDSLYYQLINPMANGAPIPNPLYVDPANSNSFSIDLHTGTVTWDTPVMICSYVFAYKITESRKIGGNYYFVGTTMQEVWNDVTPYSGISENKTSAILLNVFPNPTTDIINFSLSNKPSNKTVSLRITNALGQIIKTITLADDAEKMNVQGLNAGIYFYTLYSDSKLLTHGNFIVTNSSLK